MLFVALLVIGGKKHADSNFDDNGIYHTHNMSIPYEGVPLDEEQEPAEDGSLFETIKTWANSKILGTGLSFAKSTFEGVKTFATEGNLSLRSIGMGAAGALFLVGFLGTLYLS